MPFDIIGLLGIICLVLAILILVNYIHATIVVAIILAVLGLFLIGGRYAGGRRL